MQGFVWALQASLVGRGLDSKHDFATPTILFGASLLPLNMGYLFWWDPTFSCWWTTNGCSAVSWNFGILSGEDELTSFYSTILSNSTANGDRSPEIKRHFFLGRKAMTNLDSIIKSRDITLLTKICLVNAMVLPIVMYGCKSWTIKKLRTEELVLLNCSIGEDS